MLDIETRPEVKEISGEVQQLEQFAASYKVTTAEQFEAGAQDLKRVKAAQKKLDDTRAQLVDPAYRSWKNLCDFFKGPTDRLALVERTIKRALSDYAAAEEKRRREEQRKADEAARRERERLAAQAARAVEKGNVQKAAEIEERSAAVVAPVIHREPPKVAGISMREAWQFEITDPSVLPREFLVPDEAKIRRVVQAMKGDTRIDGVRVWPTKQVAAGAA